ncbi:MAG TPA: pitrilysin family protein [Thermoanaerobaculia bacterium]|nr:pitrilysin family protein [Thermoanaerobaculia bacterium]
MRRRELVAAVLVSAASAAALLAQAPDRSRAPAPGPPPALKLPAIQKFELSNRVPVLFIETHKVPLVEVAVVLRSGAAADPKGKPGLANLTAVMLDRGAGSRSALELSDEIDHLGAEIGASADWDETAVAVGVPSERLGPALAIFSDVVRKPTFPAEELERVRKEMLTTFLQWRDEPEAIARVAFARAIYGDHAYGRVTEGNEAFVRSVSREDLERFHRAAFAPGNATIVAAGDVTAANLKTLLEASFGSWSGTGEKPPAVPEAQQVKGRSIWIVDVPDAAQSEIRVGRVGAARSTPDFFPMLVANTMLGGSFASRLNMNLREAHGYAYGASSGFDFRLSAGPFYAAAAVQTDKTSPALAEFFKELEGMRKPVGEDELTRARNYLALRYPRGFETTGQLATRLEAKVVYDLPDDYFTSYTDRIAKVTAADVARIAARYIDPSSAAVVVVGDRRKIEAGIRALNLGPVRVFTVDQILGGGKPRAQDPKSK